MIIYRDALLATCTTICSLAASLSFSQAQNKPPESQLNSNVSPDWFALPAGANFGEVAGVAVDERKHVYVFHRGEHPLLEFDEHGKFLRGWGDKIITHAHSVRSGRGNGLWLVDDGGHIVLKIDATGRILMVFGRKDRPGEFDARGRILFDRPTDVAVNRRGEIYITDGYNNARVVKFDESGRFLRAWGKKGSAPGEFNVPHAVVIDSADRVYIADRDNRRIQVFNTNGDYITEFTGFEGPQGLSLTAQGTLLVADGYSDKLYELDLSGRVLGVLGGPGRAPGLFSGLHAVAAGPDDSIYVAELLNWRPQRFLRVPKD